MSRRTRAKANEVSNDGTIREEMWRRYPGDDWAAFDQLPPAIRRRLTEHAYDAWSVNTLMLWRRYRRLHGSAEKAQRALLRYLDFCERLERRAFAEAYAQDHGAILPHIAADVGVLRYEIGLRKEVAAF
jgi:hypothetical protein